MSVQNETECAEPVPFTVRSEAADGITTIVVSGELDLSTAPKFAEDLQEAIDAAGAIAIDFSDCGFVDSTGIALLVSAWKQLGADSAQGGNARFVLFGVGGQVRRTFDIARLESSIPILPDRGEAIAALRGLRADSE